MTPLWERIGIAGKVNIKGQKYTLVDGGQKQGDGLQRGVVLNYAEIFGPGTLYSIFLHLSVFESTLPALMSYRIVLPLFVKLSNGKRCTFEGSWKFHKFF